MTTPAIFPTLPRLPKLDPGQHEHHAQRAPGAPDSVLRVFLVIFDDDAGREFGVTCAVGAETPETDVTVVCGFLTDPTSPIALDPTLPLADAMWAMLTAKYAQENRS